MRRGSSRARREYIDGHKILLSEAADSESTVLRRSSCPLASLIIALILCSSSKAPESLDKTPEPLLTEAIAKVDTVLEE